MTQLSFLPYEPPNKYTSALNVLQAHERPSYRAATMPSACTTLELLAAVIGGPRQIETAQKVLEKFITLREMQNARVEEFQEIPGVGKSTAERIKASVGLGLRVLTDSPSADNRPTITSPSDAAEIIRHELAMFTEEHFWVLVLNNRNQVVDIDRLYQGSVNSVQIRVGEVFQTAVRLKAKSIIPAHNHPTGDPTPSPDDVAVTRAIIQAGKLLDIDTLDHLVIGQGRWVSMKERGLGFS
jgi:DNA repair protein RadC